MITVRTYKENNSTKSYSENVLDSFSESSTNEMEKLIENETAMSTSSSSENNVSKEKTRSGNVGANIGGALFKILTFGVSGGFSGGSSTSASIANSATRSSNVRSLNKALDKHISTSNSNRSIEINTSTTESQTEGEETSIVREVQNINKSRVLNFVFRQLLQQYVAITYLSNVKIAFCNGYEESLRVVDLEEIDKLLEDTVMSEQIERVKQTILKNYCTIFDYQNKSIPFIEKVEHHVGECFGLNETETFWRIRKDIRETWRGEGGGLEITVNGPILNVTTHTLKTSSTVVDALLGQGEALDCYNMKIQDADALKSQIGNIELLQQLETIQAIEDPLKRAELYKKVFGTCCDTPQTQIIS